MDEREFRQGLSKEELEERATIAAVKIYDFELLERLNTFSTEYSRT